MGEVGEMIFAGIYRSIRRSRRKIFISFSIIIVITTLYLHIFSSTGSSPKQFGVNLRHASSDFQIQGFLDNQKGQACIHPNLMKNHPDVIRFFKDYPRLFCNREEDWVYTINGTFYISKSATEKNGEIMCDYIPVLRGLGDFQVIEGERVRNMKNGSKLVSDFFKVTCYSRNGRRYNNIYMGIASDPKLLERSKQNPLGENSLGLDIIMFGFDSVSRMTWLRKLPKTYEYLTNVLKMTVFEGYNIVGDGTPQALLPILTGRPEPELPEARRGHKGAKPVDGHPWIWKKLKDIGYVSQWGEDMVHIGTFTYRMLGFLDQPVDHYARPFYLEAGNKYYKWNKANCLGSLPRHRVMLNALRDLFMVYKGKPKFSFLFHSECSHDDNNPLNTVDDDLSEFLQVMNEGGYLDNALLILMSDHGARFMGVRETVQGKYEERNPFFAVRLPEWVHQKYPYISDNLKFNTHRLVTPFDIHATFEDVINFQNKKIGDLSNRGISVFQEIPKERTCADASIEPHWCNCLNWQNVNVNDHNVMRAADALVSSINNMTKVERQLCGKLSVTSISYSVMFTPNDKVLRFKQSKDMDGRFADLSAHTKIDTVLYQVRVRTEPGGGHYEATLRHNIKRDIFLVNPKEISRINAYGNNAFCIQEKLPILRQYCYCIR